MQGNELDSGALPNSRHHEKDAGRYIGSHILVCKDPDTGVRYLAISAFSSKAQNGCLVDSRWADLKERMRMVGLHLLEAAPAG